MNSELHFTADTYGTFPEVYNETVPTSFDGVAFNTEAREPVSSSIARIPPSYQEAITSNRVRNVNGLMEQAEGTVAPSKEVDGLEYSPFDEFIIEGYENVGEQLSKLFLL